MIRNALNERNELSSLLNQMMKKSGQAECERRSRKIFSNNKGISESGGWCKKESSENSIEHKTDEKLVKYLSNFLKGKRVASFGDGPGMYKKYLDRTNMLELYDAYDGAPFAENVTDGRVKFLDLSVPQYGLPVYDWAISLEVAEHIPAKYEKIFLSNLVRHAKTGIIMSWAVPGQDGYGHINNQPKSYVIQSMKKLGFDVNIEG